MKNVAGYDVSRLMAGSMGCLGILLEATVKVVPVLRADLGVAFDIGRDRAGAFINDLRREGLPVSATCHDGQLLKIRFSAGEKEIAGLPRQLDKHYSFVAWQIMDESNYWTRLKEHDLPFFKEERELWRLSVPPQASFRELVESEDDLLTEWGGRQHWLKTKADPATVFETMASANGHATLFRKARQEKTAAIFQPLSAIHLEWHRQLKQAFDPAGILNPGKMYPEF
jgi:glycolate oxidase FAD binding subunit